MPIEIACPGCHKRMRAPDAAAGKQVKCPACQGPIVVPSARAAPPIQRWTLLTENDQQFGPIPRSELDQWFAEGRISAQCQLLKEGAPAWQWASDIFPSLAQATAPPPAAPSDPLGIGVSANPYVAPGATHTSAVSRSYRGHRSAAAGYATTMAYVAGGSIVARGLLAILLGAMAFSNMGGVSSRYATERAIATSVLTVIVFFVAAVVATPFFVAGMGLAKRRMWGKVMGFVTAALAIMVALFTAFSVLRLLINYSRLSSIGFSLPAEVHFRIVGLLLLDLLFLAIMIGHAVVMFMVLLNAKHAKEFQS